MKQKIVFLNLLLYALLRKVLKNVSEYFAGNLPTILFYRFCNPNLKYLKTNSELETRTN